MKVNAQRLAKIQTALSVADIIFRKLHSRRFCAKACYQLSTAWPLYNPQGRVVNPRRGETCYCDAGCCAQHTVLGASPIGHEPKKPKAEEGEGSEGQSNALQR